MTITELLAVLLVVAGTFFGLVAVVGIVRLPDLYTRAHATSKSDTLGILLTLGGVALVFGADLAVAKTVLLALFMFVTNPTAAHAITRAAYDQDIAPWTVDDAGPDAGESDDGSINTGAVQTDGVPGDSADGAASRTDGGTQRATEGDG